MVFVYFLIIIFGLVIGSFIGAYTYRWPKNISIAKGRSFCPKCKKPIKWYDNIPLFSFLLLGRSCRNCGKKISLRYPVIEATTALLFVSGFRLFLLCGAYKIEMTSFICNLRSISPWFVILLFAVISTLLIILIIDFENQLIPDRASFFLFILAFLLLLSGDNGRIYVHLASAFLAALFILVLHILTLGRGMGLGDVKFVLAGGLMLGYPQTITWLFVSFLLGAVVGITMILIGKAKFGQQIAFGPFLVISLLLILTFGGELTGILLPYL